jgi:hypothetical protein
MEIGIEALQDPSSMEMTPLDWDYWNTFYEARGIEENPHTWS